MKIVVEITSELDAGRRVWLHKGQTVKVGRGETADFAVSADSKMSTERFALECSSNGCLLRDLQSTNGTAVNGDRVSQVVLKQGDQIVAGDTRFAVAIEGGVIDADIEDLVEASVIGPVAASDRQEFSFSQQVITDPPLEYLSQLSDPLFAILDAARDPMILPLLMQSDHVYQSLYEGTKGEALCAVAPYLLHLPSGSTFLETLIDQGWGNSWGIYLTCDQSFKDVRKHFRRLLMVKIFDGQKVYFRFYDPRVFRLYVPSCLPNEAQFLFGPVLSFLLEDKGPENLLRFDTRVTASR